MNDIYDVIKKPRVSEKATVLHEENGVLTLEVAVKATKIEIKQAVEKASPGKPVDAMTEMYIRVYVLGAVQFTCEWILGKFEADPEKLAMVYEQTLPPPLQRRLSE